MFNYLKSLAQSPEKSWKRFKLAVGLFIVAVVLIFLGANTYALIQVPGLLLLSIALIFAIWGYIGILCHRLFSFKQQWKPKSRFKR